MSMFQFVCVLTVAFLINQQCHGFSIDFGLFNPHDAITTTSTTPAPSPLASPISAKCMKAFKDCQSTCNLFTCSRCYSLVISCVFEETINKRNQTKPTTTSSTMSPTSTSSMSSTSSISPTSTSSMSSTSSISPTSTSSMSSTSSISPTSTSSMSSTSSISPNSTISTSSTSSNTTM